MGTPALSRPPSTRRHPTERTTRLLLACGAGYAVTYVVANDVIGALMYDYYDRLDQAVSELSALGAPSRPFLVTMLPVFTALMIAFGVGVWRAAPGSRSLRVVATLLVAFGATGLLWLPFPMSARDDIVEGAGAVNDVGHLVMAGLTVVLIVSQIGFSAVALGGRFRLYALGTVATVLLFGALSGRGAASMAAGGTTPGMGLYERLSIGAWLLWLTVLGVALMRRTTKEGSR